MLNMIGRNSYMSIGSFDYESATGSFYAFYGDYMRGNLKASVPGYSVSNYNSVRFATADIFICPSNRRPNYYRISYMMCAGSALDRKVKLSKLCSAANALVADKVPALWADRCNMNDQGNNGGLPETNHNANKLPPKGGNVASADGSAAWFPYKFGNDINQGISGQYVSNGSNLGGHIVVPSNAMWPMCDGNGNVYDVGGFGAPMLSGAVACSLSPWF